MAKRARRTPNSATRAGPREVRRSAAWRQGAAAPWVSLLPEDPRPWLLASDEASARWLALACLADPGARDEKEACRARHDAFAEPGVQALLARLPQWGAGAVVSGHNSPGFAPNLLHLLADLGVAGGQDERVEALLDAMLERQRDDGRFPSFGSYPRAAAPVWGALPCDAHAITEVLVRFGRGGDERVQRALDRIEADLAETDQGPGWLCLPDEATGFRGPGRKFDVCPQVSLEALRVFSRLPDRSRPAALPGALRTALACWRERATRRPYMFGHGRRFKTIKWPTFWYDVHAVLDTLGRFPELWRGAGARDADRRSLAELAACMLAYNVGPDGRVTPRSCYRGFEAYSFGQKKRPSPFATARVLVVLRRLGDLADEIAAVDVAALPSGHIP